MIKEFEKIKGHYCHAPYIECLIEGKEFVARIDTGADITCIPASFIPDKSPFLNSTTISGNSGLSESVWTRKVTIKIDGIGEFTPERGVLKREGNVGLIGMDILNQCELHMVGGVFILELQNDYLTLTLERNGNSSND